MPIEARRGLPPIIGRPQRIISAVASEIYSLAPSTGAALSPELPFFATNHVPSKESVKNKIIKDADLAAQAGVPLSKKQVEQKLKRGDKALSVHQKLHQEITSLREQRAAFKTLDTSGGIGRNVFSRDIEKAMRKLGASDIDEAIKIVTERLGRAFNDINDTLDFLPSGPSDAHT